MADLIQSIQDMLKEETWTRQTIDNYSENNLKELASLIEQAKNENCLSEIKAICEEHLSHSKDSIIALYICGILDLKEGALDNTPLVTLVGLFKNNMKENIVTYLCESILKDDPNNRFALNTKADMYLAKKDDKVWEVYEQIVKSDFNEANLAKLLAEHYEEEGKDKIAEEYYRKAILRFINQNNYTACKEIWAKLVEKIPDQIDFFQLLRNKIAKTMGENKTTTLMEDLYDYYKKEEKWDTAIMILKQNLEIDPTDSQARKNLEACYRGKHKDNPNLEKFIRASNISQGGYRNVFEAINDFEKHIAFDVGRFVFHRNWGVGRIMAINGDELTINFGNTGGERKMMLSMAISALKPLDKNHIWVLKARDRDGKLAAKVKENPKWALKTIIRSFDNNCDFKRIKAELVSEDEKHPLLIEQSKWTSWSAAAKKILESDPDFGVNPNDVSMYTVRDHAISKEEKLANEFKAQKQFFARADIFMKYANDETTNKSNELFTEMYTYFTGYLKNISKVNEQVLASYLIIQDVGTKHKEFSYTMKETFAQLYSKIDDPREIYTSLKDTKNTNLRGDFLVKIRMLPDWAEQYINLFPTVLDMDMLRILISEGHTQDVQNLIVTAFEQYKDYRDAVLFFFDECQDFDWYKEAGVSYEKQLVTLINLIVLTFKEINNHVNSTENKKIQKNAIKLLFKDKDKDSEEKAKKGHEQALLNYLKENDIDTVSKMYTLIDDISDLDPIYKQQTRNVILEKFPDFKFRVTEEKSQQQSKGMLVTEKMLKLKKAEIDNLEKVELPRNAQDIAEAKARGDLKENAEYKAAREEQHMLSLKLSSLRSELGRAVVFDPTTSTTSVVSFATVVTLTNNDTKEDEVYTILGPWESNPDQNIVSYMTPLGNAIMDKKVGESVKYSANEKTFNYTIKKIEKATNY